MGEMLPRLLGGYALLTTGALLAIAGGRRRRRNTGDKLGQKTINLVLLALGGFLLVFIVAMTVIFCVKGSVPDTLIQYTLGAGGVEAFLCAGITVSKVITGDKPGESGDCNEEKL